VVRDVLRSPGQALPGDVQTSMTARLGHDFSQVRVHTDTRAAESADAVNSLAYTVGSHIAFGPGQYAPNESAGRRLLAHELTHVVQQTEAGDRSSSNDAAEASAAHAAALAQAGNADRARAIASQSGVQPGVLQRQEAKKTLDATATKIIADAQDDKTKPEERAVAAVRSIIREYHAGDAGLVANVVYDDAKAGTGLMTETKFAPSGKTEEVTGTIYVGSSFLGQVDKKGFARRVLQVGHELEHIKQWRSGLTGPKNKPEREFLAFYHEALAAEKAGTGRVQHSTRVRLIDAALGNYYCLASDKQKANESKKTELIERRATEVSASGNTDLGEAPTTCKASS
jgi:hypothetical protein